MSHIKIRAGREPRPDNAAADIVRKAIGGDRAAWDELVSRYTPLIWSIARAHRLNTADAADVSQATWLKLVQHLPRVKSPEAIGGWLATTARRECLRLLSEHARVVHPEELPEPVDGRPPLDERLLTGERDALLWRAFSRLRPSDQALLRLLAAEPAPSYIEVAAALDMPIGSIGPTRARALERLRAELDGMGGADALS
jgi:RNA polymerase sigma factor (sigma-70 family)